MSLENLYTVGQISDLLGEPPARIRYQIEKSRLKPVERLGIYRLFDGGQVEAIRQGLFDLQIRGGK